MFDRLSLDDDFIIFDDSQPQEEIDNWIKKVNLEKYIKYLPTDVQSVLDQKRKILEEKQNADFIISKINDWLSNDQKLNTGYKIDIERYLEISSRYLEQINEETSQIFFKKVLKEPEKIRIWLQDISRSINLKPHEIGTGISQVLPVVIAAVGMNASLIAIEQPELHIHPALQVRLGDLFIGQSNDKKFFLIETHSENLVLRLMRRIREGVINLQDVNVVFVEKLNNGSRFTKLRLDEDGDFIDEWPGGFFEESFHEKFAGR